MVRLLAKVGAVKEFLSGEDGTNLLTAYKRAANILRIEEARDDKSFDGDLDEGLLSKKGQKEELALYQHVNDAGARAYEAVDKENFRSAMAAIASLREPVDAFFDHVTVNCDNRKLRANRLKLLSRIRGALDRVADFSKIEGGER